MEIRRAGSQPSAKGPSDWFTGSVRIDPLFQEPDPALVQGASVTFEPGARTAWHTHPLGQTLIVTAGLRLGSALGWTCRGISSGRCSTSRFMKKRWEGRRLDGARQRRSIQKVDGISDITDFAVYVIRLSDCYDFSCELKGFARGRVIRLKEAVGPWTRGPSVFFALGDAPMLINVGGLSHRR
jgi:hypothetical protein